MRGWLGRIAAASRTLQTASSREMWAAKVAARDGITPEEADALYERIFRACRHFGQLTPETAAELTWSGAQRTGEPVASRVDILEAALAGEEDT